MENHFPNSIVDYFRFQWWKILVAYHVLSFPKSKQTAWSWTWKNWTNFHGKIKLEENLWARFKGQHITFVLLKMREYHQIFMRDKNYDDKSSNRKSSNPIVDIIELSSKYGKRRKAWGFQGFTSHRLDISPRKTQM